MVVTACDDCFQSKRAHRRGTDGVKTDRSASLATRGGTESGRERPRAAGRGGRPPRAEGDGTGENGRRDTPTPSFRVEPAEDRGTTPVQLAENR